MYQYKDLAGLTRVTMITLWVHAIAKFLYGCGEAYADNVTFTNVRLPLVRTEMIRETDVYRRSRAMAPDQAADVLVRALEDRPLTISTAVGNLTEVLNLLVPRLSDALSAAASRRYPDSPAARRPVE